MAQSDASTLGAGADTGTDGVAARVGVEVRRRRLQRSWTLDEAAARLGVSRRLLVQIEGGDANPSLGTLLSLAEGFGVALTELLSDTEAPAVTVRRNASAPVLWAGEHGGEGRLLVGGERLELWEWTLEPGDQRSSTAHRPGSVEAITVGRGRVTVAVGSADDVTLTTGTSAIFPADVPHTYRNDGTRAAAFVMAVHDPNGGTR